MDRYKGNFSDFLKMLRKKIYKKEIIKQKPNFVELELEFFTIKEKIKLSLN